MAATEPPAEPAPASKTEPPHPGRGVAQALATERRASPPFSLPPPTAEQQEAIDKLAEFNLLVNAVAGSGKTTLILHLARAYPTWSFLVLTYNRKLMDETKLKGAALGLANAEVRTYHSFAVRYLRKGRNDTELDAALGRKLASLPLDVLVVDEVQDMKDLYFRLVVKIWNACDHIPCLVFLGDEHQCVYGFARADPRFLTLAPRLLAFDPFARVFLTVSHRLTVETAAFVNGLVGEERVRAERRGPKPIYLVDDPFQYFAAEALVRRFVAAASAQDVFVLAPTVRKSVGCKRLIGRLSDESARGHVNVYAPDDDEQPREEDMKGKLAFLTYHKAKGLERRFVVVLGFDEGFETFARGRARESCAQPTYVAITRAREQLVVVQGNRDRPYSFLPRPLENFCCVQGRGGKKGRAAGTDLRCYGVCDLLRNKSFEVLRAAAALLEIETLRKAGDFLSVAGTTEARDGLTESVEEITGIAIPLAHAVEAGLDMQAKYGELASFERSFWRNPGQQNILGEGTAALELNWKDLGSTEKRLKAATAIQAMSSGLFHKLHQIARFDWLSKEQLDAAVARVAAVAPGSAADFEVPASLRLTLKDQSTASASTARRAVQIRGYLDWAAQESDEVFRVRVYEFKCTGELKDVHYLQLALYACICELGVVHLTRGGNPVTIPAGAKFEYYLFNALSGELARLRIGKANMRPLVELLLQSDETAQSDEKFVSERVALRDATE
jgi:hypothetical protein